MNPADLILSALESILADPAMRERLERIIGQFRDAYEPQEPDTPDAPDAPPPDAPEPPAPPSVPDTSRPAYNTLRKPEVLWKTKKDPRPVTRHDAALLIPKDRPKPKSFRFTGGTFIMRENYLSDPEHEDRWISRFSGALNNKPGSVTVTYETGETETFQIKSLAGTPRTQFKPGPFKPSAGDGSIPSTPSTPSNDPQTPPSSGQRALDFDPVSGKIFLPPIVEDNLYNALRLKLVIDDRSGDGVNFNAEPYCQADKVSPGVWQLRRPPGKYSELSFSQLFALPWTSVFFNSRPGAIVGAQSVPLASGKFLVARLETMQEANAKAKKAGRPQSAKWDSFAAWIRED